MIFNTLQVRIDSDALTLTNEIGNSIDIRPKTCQLLIELLKSGKQPVSKQYLLDTVWSNSVVNEQVVFQSVNEIRQLFPEQEVIKTIPKQGYLWLPDVDVDDALNDKNTSAALKVPTLTSVGLIFIALITLISISLFDKSTTKSAVQGSVIILPANNLIEGYDHSWVRLGMMDQVIQRLPNTESSVVLETDYVFEVLRRADSPLAQLTEQDIQQIFLVSGAELIIDSVLSGSPQEYKLNYTFYYRDRLKKGVLFEQNLQTLIDNFSQFITAEMGDDKRLENINYSDDFHSQLLGRAIEKQLDGDNLAASSLFESVIQSNPENLTAQRLFIGSLLRLRHYDQAYSQLNYVIPMAMNRNDKKELTRLLYLKALYYYVVKDDASSARVAEQALEAASGIDDWLMMAHITNVQGNLALNEQDYQKAENLYLQEMQYHEIIHCPVGQSNSWATLARLAKSQNQKDKFLNAIDRAISIAETRGLAKQKAYFEKLKNQ